jgi:hypothetical protein
MLTAEQKPFFRKIYIPGLVLAGLMAVILFWQQKEYGSRGDGYSSYTITRPLNWLLKYLVPFFCAIAWGWDWWMQQKYNKAAWLLLVALFDFVLNEKLHLNYELEKLYSPGRPGAPIIKLLTLTYGYLLGPVTWYGIARGIIEKDKKLVLAGWLSGLVMYWALNIISWGGFEVNGLFKSFLQLIDIFNGSSRLYFFIQNDLVSIFSILFYLFMPGLALWLYYFFKNMLADKIYSFKEIFTQSYYNDTGPWYFAMCYPVYYLICFLTAAALSRPVLFLFKFPRHLQGITKLELLLTALFYAAVLYFFFRLLRNLVIGRCITLHQRIGLMYYLSFIPVLNIIPYIWFISTRKEFSESEKMEYAEMMNDSDTSRHRFTVGFILVLSALPLFVLLVETSGYTMSSKGVVLLWFTIGQFICLLLMLSRPGAMYGIIGLQAVLILYYNSDGDGLSRMYMEDAVSRLITLVLALSWYQKIFHPDVYLEIDYQFAAGETPGVLTETDAQEPPPGPGSP